MSELPNAVEKGDVVELTITDDSRENTISGEFKGERTVDKPGSVVVGDAHGTRYYLVPTEGGELEIKASGASDGLKSYGTVIDVNVEGLDEDEEENELVADGGEDVTEHVDDESIEEAINAHARRPEDDPLTVEDVRDVLAALQKSAEAMWGEWLDNIEHGETELVAETDALLVLNTGEHAVYEQELEPYDGDVTIDDSVVDVVKAVHHDLARQHSDYDWGYTYPLVVRKPADFEAGQGLVEAVVNGLQRRGLSPGQAWAYYGVEIRGNSMNSWGKRKGDHDHRNVSDALDKARKKLP